MRLFIKIIASIAFFSNIVNAMVINDQIAAKLASDAYLDKQKFANIYKSKDNKISTAEAYGVRYYLIEDKKNTIVVIRGTDNIRNAITDVMAVESKFLNNEFILVHDGFYKVSKKIFKTIKLDTAKPVILVGHSLGGAVSLLYGAMLSERGIDISLYTFGMPPIVNKAFLKKYKNLKHNRHFHIFDPVPSLSKPTIQVFQTQMRFKSFQSAKNTISNMVSTIKNIPDKYRHHGINKTITDRLNITKEKLKKSLFYRTCTLYFDYHKIDNYIQAIGKYNDQSTKPNGSQVISDVVSSKKVIKDRAKTYQKTKKIRVIPSVLKGTTPLEVEFYIDTAGHDIGLYYFNFAGKELLTENLKHNKVSHKFTKAGKHKVIIAMKDKNNNMVETELTVTTREPTFSEYQETMGKEFSQYLNSF